MSSPVSGSGDRESRSLEKPPLHERPVYKWLVTVCVMIGTLIYAMQAEVVNVALPSIMASFGVNLDTAKWVVTAYMLGLAILMPSTGWLGDRLGHRTLYALSVGLFTLASGLCGLAWSMNFLIFARVVQGMAGGALLPIAMVLFYETFPEEQRGLAMGIYALGSVLGPAFGPVFGGYCIDELNWRLIFYLNIPFGLASFVMAVTILKETPRTKGKHFDLYGFALMTLCLSTLLIALSQGQRLSWFQSAYIRNLLITFTFSLVAFLFVELKVRHPFVDLRLYRNTVYSSATAVSAILGIAFYGSSFIVPIFLQKLLPYSPFRAGVVMMPGALMFATFLMIAGMLVNRVPARIFITLGLGLLSAALFWLSDIVMETSQGTIVVMLILRGIGLGFIFTPLINAALACLPMKDIAMGSGLFNVMRYIFGMFGIAVIETMIERREIIHKAIMAEGQRFGIRGTETFLSHFEDFFSYVGNVDALAQVKSLALLDRLVRAEALLGAYSDCFLILAVLMIITILPALFIRTRKSNA